MTTNRSDATMNPDGLFHFQRKAADFCVELLRRTCSVASIQPLVSNHAPSSSSHGLPG
jgi:hypothetical protein